MYHPLVGGTTTHTHTHIEWQQAAALSDQHPGRPFLNECDMKVTVGLRMIGGVRGSGEGWYPAETTSRERPLQHNDGGGVSRGLTWVIYASRHWGFEPLIS